MVHKITAFGLIIFLCGAASLPTGAGATTHVGDITKFDGKWDGKYTPSDGEPGEGKYDFGQEKDGRWTITVTWIDKGTELSMKIKGERLGPDAVRLEGEYKDTTYWYIGRMENKNTLALRYLSVNHETGKSGTGQSVLTRPK